MIRKAIVAAVGDSWIDLLSLDEVEKAHDESCGNDGGSCGSSGCGCRVSGRPFRAAVPRKIIVKAGDTVVVTASAGRAIGASLLVLGIPILTAIAGWILVNNLFPSAQEASKAAGAAMGLIGGAGLTVLLGSRGKGDKLPEITSVLG